jgi:menaquinone-dependent protoporphyrinogen oxidase
MKILVVYASVHGSTQEVAEFTGRILSAYGADVTVADARDILDISAYDAIVMGSAIHGGLWVHEMREFVDRFEKSVGDKPVYFFITCIRALEADGYAHAKAYYVDHETLRSFNLRDVTVFTGKLRTDAIDRNEAWYLASNYDGNIVPGVLRDDFRDWTAITTWASNVAKDLKMVPSFEPVPELA